MADQRGVLLTVAYDGGPFAGFVAQPGQSTVAASLLDALRQIDGSIAQLRVASRTDAGVHARDQRVAFDTVRDLPARAWVRGPARHLPTTIAIRRAAVVAAGFQPRFETIVKTYRYLLYCQPVPDPLLDGRAWWLASPIALDKLEAELRAAQGTHGFGAFRSARDPRQNLERHLSHTTVRGDETGVIAVDITGDGFLHHMVRILIGTVVDVARGRLAPGAVSRALQSGRRTDAGVTAPPHGLYLERVQLRDDGRDPWPDSAPS